MKSKKLDLFICISCGVVIAGFIFFSTDPKTLAGAFRTLDLRWLLAAVFCMPVYWSLEALALHILLKKRDPGRRFRDTLRVSMGGQYFNAITPFSTGGQPFQAYYLTKQGMDVGAASSCLLGRFLEYQVALVAVSTVLLLARLSYFRAQVTHFSLVVLVGYAVNAAVLAGLLAVGLWRGAADRVCRWAIRLGAHLRLVKDKEKTLARAEESLDRFHRDFQGLLRHQGPLWTGFCLSVLQLLAYLSVPYFVYRAFGLSAADPLTLIGAEGFVMMISSFVPIPGAGVGAEGSFYFFFRHFFPVEGQVAVAMILWRLITFYLTVAVGVGFALKAGGSGKRKERDKQVEDRSVQ
ncbi:MAG: flippase-like domain-containing protein [Clostridia bacterium]|nr:flippase-like domain-containing protein [Clostridia bacterium]